MQHLLVLPQWNTLKFQKKLLTNGSNVYIDKPISLNFDETQKLVKFAEEK